MERLDEILRTEEAARSAITEARERAAEIGNTAIAEAERIAAESARDAAQEADRVADAILREADAEAKKVLAHGESARASEVSIAESRFERAVLAAVRSVME
ncbi:MAG: hypothetical protein KGZ40_02700 [Clostridiales bacterium]|nr:hypothetical protein [Clostridiales bacterium]